MKPESDFDAYLTRQFDDAALPDQGFSEAVTDALARRRRRARAVVGVATGGVSVALIAALSQMPWPNPGQVAAMPGTIAAVLALAALCALIWIGTESLPSHEQPSAAR